MKKGTCAHFCGNKSTECKIGINYEKAKQKSDGKLPCIRKKLRIIHTGDNSIERWVTVDHGSCEHYQEPAVEQIDNQARIDKLKIEMTKRLQTFMRELRKEVVEGGCHRIQPCDVCKNKIDVIMDRFTGKIQAKCRTKNCVLTVL